VHIYHIIFVIEPLFPLIPLITLSLKRSGRPAWIIYLRRYLVSYIILVALANSVYFLGPLWKEFLGRANNSIVNIILSALTFCFFALLLEEFLSSKFKTINRTIMFIAVLFFIANTIWWEGIYVFNTYSAALANFILISYCVYYYKRQLQNLQTFFIEKQPSFWIVSGIFIYCAGNFFLFTMYNYLTFHNSNFAFYSWYINDFLLIVMNVFFAKGILCSQAK
jgi:hypothetical protein